MKRGISPSEISDADLFYYVHGTLTPAKTQMVRFRLLISPADRKRVRQFSVTSKVLAQGFGSKNRGYHCYRVVRFVAPILLSVALITFGLIRFAFPTAASADGGDRCVSANRSVWTKERLLSDASCSPPDSSCHIHHPSRSNPLTLSLLKNHQ